MWLFRACHNTLIPDVAASGQETQRHFTAAERDQADDRPRHLPSVRLFLEIPPFLFDATPSSCRWNAIASGKRLQLLQRTAKRDLQNAKDR